MMKRYSILIAIALAAIGAGQIKADVIDLTNPIDDAHNKGYITYNENTEDEYLAWFYWVDAASTGSGVIDSFVQINQSNSTYVQGYNSDYRSNKDPIGPEFDETKSGTFNHSLLLTSIPTLTINNILYREFLLDINERNSNEQEAFLSLDKIEIYQSNDNELHSYASWEDPIFSLDVPGNDSYIWLDYAENHGSGSGDMFLYVPNSLFDTDLTYVYLYSAFGENYENSGGFEEWAVRIGGDTPPPPPPPVPVPGAALLGMIGIFMAGKKLRKYA